MENWIKKHWKKVLVGMALLMLGSCGGICLGISLRSPNTADAPTPMVTASPEFSPELEPESTATPTSTNTPKPTVTLAPTSTSTPLPTPTPVPTLMPTPVPITNTPLPLPTTVPEPTATPEPPTPPGVCDCYGDLYNCKDFGTQQQAQACFDHCVAPGRPDIHKLDFDDDGIACESLP